MLLNHSFDEPVHKVEGLRDHKEKQAKIADWLRSCLRLRAIDELFFEQGEADKSERLFAALNFTSDCASVAARHSSKHEAENAIASHPELGPVFVEIRRRMSADPTYAIAEQATKGELDKIKQRGFYVDITAGGVHTPRSFSQEDASLYLRAADIVTDSISLNGAAREKPVFLSYAKTTLIWTPPEAV